MAQSGTGQSPSRNNAPGSSDVSSPAPLTSNLAQTPPTMLNAGMRPGAAATPPAVHGGQRTSVTDHPLASPNIVQSPVKPVISVPNLPPPPPPPPSVVPGPGSGMAVVNTHAIPKVLSSPVSPSKNVEDMADSFLRGDPHALTMTSLPDGSTSGGKQPLLRPPPLPHTNNDVARLRVLVERRAWGDVLTIASTLLKGPTSHYSALYKMLHSNPKKLPAQSIQSHEETVIEILMLQCHAWLQMRRYKELGQELARWAKSFCPYVIPVLKSNNESSLLEKVNTPSWVPWSLHILGAASLQYTSSPGHAMDALWKVRDDVLQVDQGESATAALDVLAVEHTLANVLQRQKQWRLALQAMDRSLKVLPDAVRQYIPGVVESLVDAEGNPKAVDDNSKDTLTNVLQTACQCELYTRQGRLLLQVGVLDGAEQVFAQAQSLWESVATSDTLDKVKSMLHEKSAIATADSEPGDSTCALVAMDAIQAVEPQLAANKGLLEFSRQRHQDALVHFRRALDWICNNSVDFWSDKPSSASSTATPSFFPNPGTLNVNKTYRRENWIGPGLVVACNQTTLYREISNNLSVTALYTCRLQESIYVMETLVRQDPAVALTERVALNLCTLYELSCETATATRKKRTLQLVAKRFFLHDIGPEAFRIV